MPENETSPKNWFGIKIKHGWYVYEHEREGARIVKRRDWVENPFLGFHKQIKKDMFNIDGTTTIQNGAFVTKPSFPLAAYQTYARYPCVASIDENTGFVSGIVYPNSMNDTWKYSFTEGKENFISCMVEYF